MDEECFLWAIANDPQDMAPRLIFTDWLLDYGQEAREEFIRIQVHHQTGSLPHTFTIRGRNIDELLVYRRSNLEEICPVDLRKLHLSPRLRGPFHRERVADDGGWIAVALDRPCVDDLATLLLDRRRR